MNIHEYQAKRIISQYGINIPKGRIAYTPLEAKNAALAVAYRGPWMLKAQIQSGARNHGRFLEKSAGRRSGIRLVKHRREIMEEAGKMLGATLVTPQTGPKGKLVSRIYVEAFTKVRKIFYAGLVIDRMNAAITLLVADIREHEISELAVNEPEKILRLNLDLITGASPEQIHQVLEFLELQPQSIRSLETFINGLHQAFVDCDATMLEINPAGVDAKGNIIALDAKLSIDDNAMYRHKDLKPLQDEYETEERELKAGKYGFQYSSFDGSIGCIVNGDGIALAAMDLIREKGEGTACFLNVKGGVDKDKIAAGIKIIMTNPRVEGILINVLGGFLRCNLLAEGIVAAASEVGLNVPLVVRFEGTNKDEAKEILEHSKLPLIIADSMEDSVDKLIAAMEASD